MVKLYYQNPQSLKGKARAKERPKVNLKRGYASSTSTIECGFKLRFSGVEWNFPHAKIDGISMQLPGVVCIMSESEEEPDTVTYLMC